MEKDRRQIKRGEWFGLWLKFIGDQSAKAPSAWLRSDRAGKDVTWKNIKSFGKPGTGGRGNQYGRKDWTMKSLKGAEPPSSRHTSRKRRSDLQRKQEHAKRRIFRSWDQCRRKLVKEILVLLNNATWGKDKLTKNQKLDVIR